MTAREDKQANECDYFMPAEFEPIEAVWLTYPHNAETWPGCLDKAQRQYDQLLSVIAARARVEEITRGHRIPTNDSWARDYGPIFVRRRASSSRSVGPMLAAHNFRFNAWGEKYEPYDADDRVPTAIAEILGIPLFSHDFVLEGGSIEVNGAGTVMTTQQCLLNPNRNPGVSLEQIEAKLRSTLGAQHIIWLPGGIIGDDTDGHVDDIARFITPTTAAAVKPQAGHPDHEVLSCNWETLQSARDQDGRPLDLVPLPAPQPIYYDFPPDRFGPGGRHPVPASYANFLLLNGAVLLPVFGQASDDEAARTLRTALPDYEIIPLRCEYLVVGLGAIHCLTQQQPAA